MRLGGVVQLAEHLGQRQIGALLLQFVGLGQRFRQRLQLLSGFPETLACLGLLALRPRRPARLHRYLERLQLRELFEVVAHGGAGQFPVGFLGVGVQAQAHLKLGQRL